jgi:hypothetical protein
MAGAIHKITSGGEGAFRSSVVLRKPLYNYLSIKYIYQASLVLAEAFEKDYAALYQLGPQSYEEYTAHLLKHFELALAAAVSNSGSIEEIDGWRSVGVFMPPGTRVEISIKALETNLNPIGRVEPESCRVRTIFSIFPFFFEMECTLIWHLKCIFSELPTIEDQCRFKGMPGYPDVDYYYLSLVGTKNEARGHGLCSAIIRRYQAIAEKKKLPIWLEAGDEHSLRLYMSLGFKVVEKMVLG